MCAHYNLISKKWDLRSLHKQFMHQQAYKSCIYNDGSRTTISSLLHDGIAAIPCQPRTIITKSLEIPTIHFLPALMSAKLGYVDLPYARTTYAFPSPPVRSKTRVDSGDSSVG
ncbi:hypothetical protein N7G274_004955 [Stereocaulon virgatum]|uniref:Uncharacterized protein n=1 Tax=Stereocaulon virgatum TaxID=373712 RepID=A0ABR4A9S3_9LECA